MKVKSLTLRSFRGIDNLTLDFDPNVTVLIGSNGVGKTRILNCLATLLSHFEGELCDRYISLGSRGQLFLEYDVTDGSERLSCAITTLYESEEITWSLSFEIGEDRAAGKLALNLEELRKAIELVKSKLTESVKASIPLITYYPVNRTVVETSLDSLDKQPEKKITFTQLAAYDETIKRQVAFEGFFTWFKQQEDLENELRLHDDSSYRDRHLEAVRKAIPEFLPGFSNLRVRRSPLRMTVQKQGQELIVNQLSDGEKCLLAMVGDLARRLAIANPGLPDPLQGEGVVLIDEIELHLHPEWQRRIIPSLTQTFPNCQFIITTHSPQILGEIQNGIVYRLSPSPKGIVAEKMQTYGRDSNQILEDVMDVSERSPTFKNDLRRLFRLIEDGKLDEAKRLQQELENSIQYDEPEFAKSDALIRRKEVLGR